TRGAPRSRAVSERASKGPPDPRTARHAPGNPGRSSITRGDREGHTTAPNPQRSDRSRGQRLRHHKVRAARAVRPVVPETAKAVETPQASDIAPTQKAPIGKTPPHTSA